MGLGLCKYLEFRLSKHRIIADVVWCAVSLLGTHYLNSVTGSSLWIQLWYLDGTQSDIYLTWKKFQTDVLAGKNAEK